MSETEGVVQEPQVSVPTDQPVSATEAVYTADQVRFFAEAQAAKVQGAKDKEIADIGKQLNLGRMAAEEHLRVQEELAKLREAEVSRLEGLAKGNAEALDVIKLKKDVVQAAAEVARRQKEMDWEALELIGLREEKANNERFKQVKELGVEFNLSDEQVGKLYEGGGSLEQLRFYAGEFGRMNASTGIPTAPAQGVPAGGTGNWEAIKKAYAEGKIDSNTYEKARKERGLR